MPAPNRPLLVLASTSPRRQAYMRELGFRFRVVNPRVDERVRPGESPRAHTARLAREKARAASTGPAGAAGVVVIGADTIVTRGGRILGKPRSRADAGRMLRALSGRWHEVVTSVCVRRRTGAGQWRDRGRTVITRVLFKPLRRAEIDAYLDTGEPMDKAGAYAVQGLAAYMIRRIEGSYTNVVGLPLSELVDLLEAAGLPAPRAGTRR
jgi:septum formation protein